MAIANNILKTITISIINANDCSFMYNDTPHTCILNDIVYNTEKEDKIYLFNQSLALEACSKQLLVERKFSH